MPALIWKHAVLDWALPQQRPRVSDWRSRLGEWEKNATKCNSELYVVRVLSKVHKVSELVLQNSEEKALSCF